jgi:hypothetical protein
MDEDCYLLCSLCHEYEQTAPAPSLNECVVYHSPEHPCALPRTHVLPHAQLQNLAHWQGEGECLQLQTPHVLPADVAPLPTPQSPCARPPSLGIHLEQKDKGRLSGTPCGWSEVDEAEEAASSDEGLAS